MVSFLKIFFFFIVHAGLSVIAGHFIGQYITEISRPTSYHNMGAGIAQLILSIYGGFFVASIIIGIIMYFLFLA